MNLSRRDALMSTLFGASYVGLRALATGLPAAFLLNPRKALADVPEAGCAAASKAQFIIMNTSGQGDPINASVPGTYSDPKIVHSSDPTMAATPADDQRAAVHGGGALGHAPPARARSHGVLAPHDEHAGPSEGAAGASAHGRDAERRDAALAPRQVAGPVPGHHPDAAHQRRRADAVGGPHVRRRALARHSGARLSRRR